MKSLICSLSGHQLVVTRNITYHVKEYKCRHCSLELTTDGKGGLTKLTTKYQEINRVLARIHNRRLLKQGLIIT